MDYQKVNLLSEKERREKECRNLQQEVNKMNTVLCSYKNNMGHQQLPHQAESKYKLHNLPEPENKPAISWLGSSGNKP